MSGYCRQGKLALAFTLGLTVSYLFPVTFVMRLLVTVVVILAVSLVRC